MSEVPQSLRERMAATREKARQERVFDIPLDGCYDNLIVGRYKALSLAESRAIGKRHETLRDELQKDLNMAADMLLAASTDLLVKENESLTSTGLVWGADAARDLFGVNLPEGSHDQRIAMLMIFPDSHGDSMAKRLVQHFLEYVEVSNAVDQEVQKVVEGESTAS